MDPIQRITPRIPAVQRVDHRVDPEQQKREEERKEQKRREPEPDEPQEEDDGLPHVDVSV